MALDKNIIKLAAVAVVGGVAKSLLSDPRPIVNNYNCNDDKPANGLSVVEEKN